MEHLSGLGEKPTHLTTPLYNFSPLYHSPLRLLQILIFRATDSCPPPSQHPISKKN